MELEWFDGPPALEGHYWYCISPRQKGGIIVEVRSMHFDERRNRLGTTDLHGDRKTIDWGDDLSGRWAGPLQEPHRVTVDEWMVNAANEIASSRGRYFGTAAYMYRNEQLSPDDMAEIIAKHAPQ